jgi:hypothetical protein
MVVPGGKSWDDDQSASCLEQESGFECLQSDENIYKLHEEEDFIMLLNVVDDEPYFSKSKTLHTQFESAASKRSNVELIRLAQWYLQAGSMQHAKYSASLDQSHHVTLLLGPSLPMSLINSASVTKKVHSMLHHYRVTSLQLKLAA